MNNQLEERIIDISLIDDERLKCIEIDKILDIISCQELDLYEEYYVKGYLWYSHPIKNQERDRQIILNFKTAIKENPEYLYSYAYLAYFYFDKNMYSNVIEYLNNIDFSYFEDRDQLWKSLKLQELLSISKLYESKIIDSELKGELQSVISSYMHLPILDIAIPRELINSILENKYKEGIKSILNNASSLINSNKFRVYFTDDIRNKFSQAIK